MRFVEFYEFVGNRLGVSGVSNEHSQRKGGKARNPEIRLYISKVNLILMFNRNHRQVPYLLIGIGFIGQINTVEPLLLLVMTRQLTPTHWPKTRIQAHSAEEVHHALSSVAVRVQRAFQKVG